MDLFKPLQDFFKSKSERSSALIDNFVFRLHYKVTTSFLLLCMLVVCTKQFFGEPIQCLSGNDMKDAYNSYCWIHGTYTVQRHYKGQPGKDMAHPGVGPSRGPNEEIHYTYYQWVCIILLLQSILFYFPHKIWNIWESGQMKRLTDNLVSPIITTEWTEKRRQNLVQFLCESNIHHHNSYAYVFAFSEVLNLVNVISQIILLDKFFGGQFISYGLDVVAFNYRPTVNEIDPTAYLFPKVTKCKFNSYGMSGSLQNKDFICLLNLNIVNEKIFVVLWFWLMFLIIVSSAAVVYRIVIYSSSMMRTRLIANQVQCMPKWHIATIVGNFKVGDWFILHQIGVNINPIIYRDLIMAIGGEFDTKTVNI